MNNSNNRSYMLFVLGYDLLQSRLTEYEDCNCDWAYDICEKIYNEFLKSEEYNKSQSEYECLQEWITNHPDKVNEIIEDKPAYTLNDIEKVFDKAIINKTRMICPHCGAVYEFRGASYDEMGWCVVCPTCKHSFDLNIGALMRTVGGLEGEKSAEVVTADIDFYDLKPEAQKKLLQLFKLKTEEEASWDIYPLATIEGEVK